MDKAYNEQKKRLINAALNEEGVQVDQRAILLRGEEAEPRRRRPVYGVRLREALGWRTPR